MVTTTIRTSSGNPRAPQFVVSRNRSQLRSLSHTSAMVANPHNNPTTARISSGGNGGASNRPSSASSSSAASRIASRSSGIRLSSS